jgi:hypothetical protein
LQNGLGYTILEENCREGRTMAYTDDWESLMNGVFGAGGRVKFGSGAAQPDTKAKTGGLPDLNAALLEQQKQAEKQKRIRKIEEKKKRDEAQENISEKAIFSPAEERISTDKISEICKEEQSYMKESTVKKVINRIKGTSNFQKGYFPDTTDADNTRLRTLKIYVIRVIRFSRIY